MNVGEVRKELRLEEDSPRRLTGRLDHQDLANWETLQGLKERVEDYEVTDLDESVERVRLSFFDGRLAALEVTHAAASFATVTLAEVAPRVIDAYGPLRAESPNVEPFTEHVLRLDCGPSRGRLDWREEHDPYSQRPETGFPPESFRLRLVSTEAQYAIEVEHLAAAAEAARVRKLQQEHELDGLGF